MNNGETQSEDVAAVEQAVLDAEQAHGPESLQVAEALERVALTLRTRKERLLDAANMSARARAIRSKLPDLVVPPAASIDQSCPFCGETIKSIAVICRYCNRKVGGTVNKVSVSPKYVVAVVIVIIGLIAINNVRQRLEDEREAGVVAREKAAAERLATARAGLEKVRGLSDRRFSFGIAYIHFLDDKNVDIRPGGDEILSGTYSIEDGANERTIRLSFMYKGSNRVAYYRLVNGALWLKGSVDSDLLPVVLQ